MKTRTWMLLLALPVLFAPAACEDEVPSLEQAAARISSYVENLDTGKLEELAKLAVEIEKDPSKAESLLREHGLDQEQFTKTIDRIQSDPHLKKLFDKAKDMAKAVH